MTITKKLNKLYSAIWTLKKWRNMGEFCNRKTHPASFGYRRYRRGKNRCSYCGAKIGKVKCVRKSIHDMLVDNIFDESPFMKLLKNKGNMHGIEQRKVKWWKK